MVYWEVRQILLSCEKKQTTGVLMNTTLITKILSTTDFRKGHPLTMFIISI